MSGIHGELTCQELVELVTDYLEGALPAGERDRFEEHLGGCEGCRLHLEQLRTTVRLAGRLSEERIAPAARADLLRALRGWKASGGRV